MPDGARNLRARLFVAGWLFAASSAFAANLSPAEQLQHMAQSLRSLDYQGSFLYQNSGRLDTLRIFHSGGGSSGERERLISLSGSRSEAVRHGELITASKQGETAVSFSGGASARLLPLIPTDPDKLPNASYGLREGNSERVAGYESQVVDIVPVDRFRYGYRLWLERSNQLPLRVALLADDQRIVEQYMFVMLSVGTAPAETELSLSDVAGKPVPARANDGPACDCTRGRQVRTTRFQRRLGQRIGVCRAYSRPNQRRCRAKSRRHECLHSSQWFLALHGAR